MAAIYTISSLPNDQIPKTGSWDLLVKKGGHMAAYALLALLWKRALGDGPSTGWLSISIALIYAILDEYHQTFVPGRNGTLIDVLVDGVGALIGYWAWRRFPMLQLDHTVD